MRAVDPHRQTAWMSATLAVGMSFVLVLNAWV